MTRKVLFILTFSLLIPWAGFSQKKTTSELKELFKDAESWFFYEYYKDALQEYLELLSYYPNNNDLNYKIGICYLNIPGQKNLSFEYLEKAVKDVSANYKEESFKETHAPLDAVFRLADAYRVNGMIDQAIETYTRFKNMVDPKIYNIQLVDDQITSCENAKKLMKEPLFLDTYNVGDIINSRYSDYNAVFSDDENAIVFMRSLPFYEAPFYSKKENGQWLEPRNLTFELGEDEDLYVSSIAADGKEIYFYKEDENDGNIAVSFLNKDGTWSRIIRLNDNINTKYWESHASISHDGKLLYFTSNRKGGYGDLDIYVSSRDSLLDWKPPLNLGPNINTQYNEETPFISKDGKTLYFSSYGHFNMGGYDIFYSNLLENGEWSKPLNMSYPINTPDNDLFYYPTETGVFAYASLFGEDSYGQRDIYKLEVYSDQHPRKFFVKGIVSVQNLEGQTSGPFSVYVIDKLTGDTIDVIHPNLDGEYMFDVLAGNYDIVYQGPGLDQATEGLSIDKNTKQKEYIINKELVPSDVVAELQVIDTLVKTRQNKPVEINLQVEKGSTLVVETLKDTTVIHREEFVVDSNTFTYKLSPLKGKTNLRFTLTDSKGNVSVKESVVNYIPKVPLLGKIIPVPKEVVTARDQLKSIAFGKLETAIGDLNLQKENIRSIEDLKNTLISKSDKYGYSPDEVIRLFKVRDKLLEMNLNVLNKMITDGGGDNLRNTMLGLDKEKEKIANNFQLVQYLNKNAERFGFTPYEVQETILNPTLASQRLRDRLLNKLVAITTGKTHEVLLTVNPDATGAVSFSDLAVYLFKLADSGKVERKELTMAMTVLASDGDPDAGTFLQNLKDHSEGTLQQFLAGIDLNKKSFKALTALVNYVQKKGKKAGCTPQDVRVMLAKAAEPGVAEIGVLKQLMEKERAEMKGMGLWLKIGLPVLAGLLIILLLIFSRKKKKKEQ